MLPINWVLILTLLGTGGQSAAIDHVDGFTTAESCNKAGERWIEEFNKLRVTQRAMFVCVPQPLQEQ
jgi:hypothetical protein